MLLQELFRMSLNESENGMTGYLRSIKEKISELSTIGLKLEDDIKLAIIVNGLSENYRYLTVTLEQQETIDFDELSARLMEEARLHQETGIEPSAMMAKTFKRKVKCYGCGKLGHVRKDCPDEESSQERGSARFAM